MNIGAETAKKIQELQILEQTLQSFLMQKQSVQIELGEAANAISELKKSGEEVYKIAGGIMVLSNKAAISSELEEKKKILELRISTIEKQEKIAEEKAEKLRKSVTEELEKNNK